MNEPELFPLARGDYRQIEALAQYYEYDMSRFCGHLSGWEFPLQGSYLSHHLINNLKSYFKQTQRYPFLVRVAGHPAGFVMVNKVGTTPDVDWNMGEFFVAAPYQRRKIGQTIAQLVFAQFPGIWEVAVIPENTGALKFWLKTISSLNDDFTQERKTLSEPELHQMIVFRFTVK
jgi:predicted acetyltransferase